MNRFLLYILIILILGVFIQAAHLNAIHKHDAEVSDLLNSSWTELLTDSVGIPAPAIHLALNSFFDLAHKNRIQNDSLLTIIDFSKPSNEKRLYILDLKNQNIVKKTYVAHGMNSGINMAESFSNIQNSNKSSLGLYLTQETYMGKHGYSLRIDGLSKGLNNNAYNRAIVIHGADYVNEAFIETNGRLGRSFGCPAIPINETNEIIDLIKNGSCLYIYHPDLIPISQVALEKFR